MQGLVATCVAAGWDHSGAVIDGSVYTWGRGVKGQLGDGEDKSRKQAGYHVAFREASSLMLAQPFRVLLPGGAAHKFISVQCGG